jgi:ABC-type branched-subunit amino acid transport system ATPase component
MTTILKAEGLGGGYTKAPILRDVSFEIGSGEIVALFGANGAGKTTLLRALSGALPVFHGEVTLHDRRIDKLSIWNRARLGLAHVPEGRHIFSSMTVRENLETGALAGRRRTTLDEVLDLFPRLAERQRQRAGTLSGGEQQMVAIGRALMSSPDALLIDEMSAGLAPVITHRLVEGLSHVRELGVAILLVEQAPHLVADVIDRAYLMEKGQIVAAGTLDELGGAAAIAELYLGVA